MPGRGGQEQIRERTLDNWLVCMGWIYESKI